MTWRSQSSLGAPESGRATPKGTRRIEPPQAAPLTTTHAANIATNMLSAFEPTMASSSWRQLPAAFGTLVASASGSRRPADLVRSSLLLAIQIVYSATLPHSLWALHLCIDPPLLRV